jgi:hypothetical protein
LTGQTFNLIFAPGRLLLVSRSSWAPAVQGKRPNGGTCDADEKESCEEEKEALSEKQPRKRVEVGVWSPRHAETFFIKLVAEHEAGNF